MKLNLDIPVEDRNIISKIINVIENSKSAFVTMHPRPDGDAIGGALAMYHILRKLGLDVEVISPSALPRVYSFLKGIDKIKTAFGGDTTDRQDACPTKDIGFVLDCSDKKRIEGLSGLLTSARTIINIDHHQLNHEFGDINYVKPKSSSVCELIFNIASQMNIEFDYDLALCIYIGIVTDTDKFQEDNTTPQSHLIAAGLIDKFISPQKVSTLIYRNSEIEGLRLVSKAIESLTLTNSKRVGYITVTPEMFQTTGASIEDLEGVINFARNIKGVEVGILFRKIPGLDGIKVSFRSKGGVNVNKIANHFGGGGHHNAAGCLIKGEFKEVKRKVLDAVEKELDRL